MRTDNDTWDITTSVGITALGVAAARAAETQRPAPLSADPFAAAFVANAGTTVFDALLTNEATASIFDHMTDYVAVRTKYFDKFFQAAAGSGIEQAVILASGLDTRAYRAIMPQRTFELDQPAVLEFKDRILREQQASPVGERFSIPVDLRHDWPTALHEAGFDSSKPTAWLAEGLLPYLPADAQNLLFSRVDELSAPGSRISIECFTGTARITENQATRKMSEEFGISITDLFPAGSESTDPAAALRSFGWSVDTSSIAEQGRVYQRALSTEIMPTVALVNGTK